LELIYGVPYAMSPAPKLDHQTVSHNIAQLLGNLLSGCPKCQALLPVDWKIDGETVVQPDNLVICHKPENNSYLSKAPTLIFEILSKSTANKDRTTKFRLYESEGVQYYVTVDPGSHVAKVYGLHDGYYIKDVSHKDIDFDLGKCQITFDFSKIWPDS